MAVRAMSPQTLAVLGSMVGEPSVWRHGYDLAKETGLKSGTLYPILIRLAERGLIQASWEEEQPAGRPRRHRYRLTTDGLEYLDEANVQRSTPRPVDAVSSPRRPMTARPRLAGESP